MLHSPLIPLCRVEVSQLSEAKCDGVVNVNEICIPNFNAYKVLFTGICICLHGGLHSQLTFVKFCIIP